MALAAKRSDGHVAQNHVPWSLVPNKQAPDTNGASCKVCINQGNVLFHMILVSRRSRRFLSFQFKSNLISMFKQRKTSPKISEASCKVSKHPQSSNADSHHVVTFLCFAWTWYSGHILSRIYSGSQTGLFLHLLPVMHCLYHSKFIGMVWKTRADIPGHLCFQTVDSRQSHALLDAFGPGLGRSKLSTYMKINMWLVVKMLVPGLGPNTLISIGARFISILWAYHTFILAKSRIK